MGANTEAIYLVYFPVCVKASRVALMGMTANTISFPGYPDGLNKYSIIQVSRYNDIETSYSGSTYCKTPFTIKTAEMLTRSNLWFSLPNNDT